MENTPENAEQLLPEQQQEQATKNSSLVSDGPVSKSEGTARNDLTDASAENSEENAGIGFGGIPQETDAITASDNLTNQGASRDQDAETDISKGQDQEEPGSGLDDGDLDTDVIAEDNEELEQARESDATD
ncbi:hypothetical protein [Pedobacter sp. W3I1]|uniref:hypothetical protein n=1 Tax=Pedobacter sp. W3I1 TaxID=3042291 RepID=UPI0027D928AF|nr:hypothetical protein [Pedobacter sp. W3I1]